jgi:hypothetical protein
MINNPLSRKINFRKLASDWGKKPPFDHIVIDDFLDNKLARDLEAEYPAWDDKMWYLYDNPIEQKKPLTTGTVFRRRPITLCHFSTAPNSLKIWSC